MRRKAGRRSAGEKAPSPLGRGGYQAAAELVEQRDEQHAEQDGWVAKGEVRQAEQLPRQVDDEVVERRVGVGGHDALDDDLVAQDLADGIAGARRRQPLVGPEAEGVEVVDAQPVAQQEEGDEGKERGDSSRN